MGERVHAGAGGDEAAACRPSAPDRQITIAGSIFGWKMTFLVCVASLVMTPARPTSEPVPAVVGTAMIGAIAVGIGARPPVADILEIPHRPRLPGHEGDQLAEIERRAAAEGDDAVMLAGLEHGDAGGRGWSRPGSASPRRRRRRRASASSRIFSVVATTGSLREAGIGDEQRPLDAGGRQASGSSAMRPAPKRTVVG